MLPSTETIDQALTDLKPLPPHSCPDVDRMLKNLQSEGRSADIAASATEDSEAGVALQDASSAIDDAASALDHERDIAAALRAGCDERESIAKLAIQGCSDRDDRIEDLEAQVQTLEAEVGERDALIENLTEIIELQRNKQEISNRVVVHLGEKIRKPWWQKLADTGKRLWWERKARGRAKIIKGLREERMLLRERNTALFDALLTADAVLLEGEWEEKPGGAFFCPQCHAEGLPTFFRPHPKHEVGCRIGTACETVRWALQIEARQQGIDPHRINNQGR